ncbi:MAG TPA: zinc dependent phospholipase C family protein [Edaphocola sp.]|nr:zinc dependent phospholipase C family protein [Edaphocola sp.]
MKTVFTALLYFIFTLNPCRSNAWGAWAHQHINRAAIFALPEPMRSFYFNHNDFLTMQASVPDLRKYVLDLKTEFPRHYFDTEAYGAHNFGDIPTEWSNAVNQYGKKKLYPNGILPWYIQLVMKKLTHAFKTRNKAAILLLSADLAHYVGDGYQPLHTTRNYDGQLSGRKGLHVLFESQLPELYGDGYNLHTTTAKYCDNVQVTAWQIVKQSHSLLAELLKAEQKVLETMPSRQVILYDKYGHARKNRYDKPYFSKAFCQAFNKNLAGMIPS